MNKILFLVLAISVFALVTPAMAAPKEKTNKVPAGNSNTAHVYLMPYEEGDDAWGQVKYNYSGESLDFVMTVKNVEPNTEYVVKSKGYTLAEGMSNPAGQLNFQGSWDCEDMSLMDGRINVRTADTNERVVWSGDEVFDVFMCEMAE